MIGMGESDKPFARYTTAEMARDVIELLDSIGWTADRELHIVGNSMGGMIAQELVRNDTFFTNEQRRFLEPTLNGSKAGMRDNNHWVHRRF